MVSDTVVNINVVVMSKVSRAKPSDSSTVTVGLIEIFITEIELKKKKRPRKLLVQFQSVDCLKT